MFTHIKSSKRILFIFAISLITNSSFTYAVEVSDVPDEPGRKLAVIEDNGEEISPPFKVETIEEEQESIEEVASKIVAEDKKQTEVESDLADIKKELQQLKLKNKEITQLYHQASCQYKKEQTVSQELARSQEDILSVISQMLQPNHLAALQGLIVANSFVAPEVTLGYSHVPANHDFTDKYLGLNTTSLADLFYLRDRTYLAPITQQPLLLPRSLKDMPFDYSKNTLETPQVSFNNFAQTSNGVIPLSTQSFDFNSQSIINDPRYSAIQRDFSFTQLNKFNTPQFQTPSIISPTIPSTQATQAPSQQAPTQQAPIEEAPLYQTPNIIHT